MYIQPCCIHRELPLLMRGTARCYFQSNVDWTLQDLMKAISCLVPSCEAVVCMPVVDVYLLRTLRTYLAVIGALLLDKDGLLHHYAAYFGRDRETYKEITGAVAARAKKPRKS